MSKLPMLIDILACPECRRGLRNGKQDGGYILKCEDCGREYPFVKAIYITDKCRTNKCKKECLSVCKSGKMEYFPWTKTSKRIRIHACDGSGECVNVCPHGAIVTCNTPSFLDVSGFDIKPKNCVAGQLEVVPEMLRKPENMFMCGHVAATYDYVSLKIEEINPDFVVDNGCGHNLFAAKYGMGRAFYTLDGNIDHHAYRKVDLLANGERLPLADDSVPMVISNFVLEHVKNPSIYLNEIKRVLKRDGILIISVPTSYWHLGNTMSIYYNFQYLLKIVSKPSYFLKNPVKHFLVERSHAKEHMIDSEVPCVTLLDEIRLWKMEKWEATYRSSGFSILERCLAGHLMSTHHLSILRKLPKPSRFGVHCTHVLRKA